MAPMELQVFSDDFWGKIDSPRERVEVADVDRGARELAVAAVFARSAGSVVWLTGENEPPGEKREKLGQWLKLLGPEEAPVHCHLLPYEDPYINAEPDPRRIADKRLLQADLAAGKRMIVLSTLAALSVRLERPESAAPVLELRAGDSWERGGLIEKLTALGYRPREMVEIAGDLAWRGNVLDVFPVAGAGPLRLEFEGRRLASLRFFDLETQRSTGSAVAVALAENRYAPEAGGEAALLTELLPGCRILAANLRRLEDEHAKLLDNFRRIRRAVSGSGKAPPEVERLFPFSLAGRQVVDLADFSVAPVEEPEVRVLPRSMAEMTEADVAGLARCAADGWRLLAFAADARLLENLSGRLPALECHFFNIPCSFENPRLRLVCLTGRNYRPAPQAERPRRRPAEEELREMAEGDWVVHRRHGIGRFAGFTRLRLEGAAGEFLKVEYLDREYLYVPLHELEVLRRYSGSEGAAPALDRLGGRTWQAKTERARKAIVHYTRELLDLYAMRKSVRKAPLPPVPELEERLQQDFRFVETEDQKQAIARVLADLEAEFPMDRLVCGDVSFGKTEVALRAALRAMANGRQVAFLCPTTILALQHFRNFEQRLAPFPLRLAMLSRLVPAAGKKRVVAGLKSGAVDLVVGTHSLLAKGVEFKRLGLFIVDEEQRFGVFQKEKLKKGRESVDVLTLSATPIPRTLSMSLSGLQDISLIQSPPLGRLAIRNYVGLFSRQVLVSAVLHELERDGAVFVVYNSIERIFRFRDQLAAWLPDVPIVVVHAQMPTAAIEKNLMDFIAGKYRVLLSTTIIENGIDIPRVNTLVVLDADRLGLTQLYQLRGRIGRSTRQAYAYFLVDERPGGVSELARKRLDGIREFSELGAGYKLAEFDLHLRGAGALLGNRQHGHVEALGYDYFLELLRQTIRAMKGEAAEAREVALRVHFPYAIGEEYIAATAERIAAYRRVLEARDALELRALRDELSDRYGQMPAGLERTFYVGAVKLFARQGGWARAEVFADRVQFDAGREIALAAGKAFRVPGLRHLEGGNFELDFNGLEHFLDLEKGLKRIFT